MRSLVFEGNTWLVYEELRQRDKRLHKNLCAILKEMLRNDPTTGLGKPEVLRHDLAGFWSRRLSQKDRLVYKFDETHLYLFAIGGHYDRFRPGR
ncbi:MAG: Txe/YoeB family addiction module toxin [Candidatus Thiosymbion ectosymbiont of Robbea hypermnestra]|nr:Txe/YoeB family addiction module toxin [Candidatus Thiosymbion ectosymbiont of Robbea hypermnestra]